MSAHLADLVEELREPARALIAACDAAGLQPRLTSTLRSRAEQTRLYHRYLAGTNQGFPVAPPGCSAHEKGEAFDLVVTPMDALADVGYTWKSWGGGWGESDAVHFELPGASANARNNCSQFDPLLEIAQLNAKLPWYVSLFTPWQLSIYNDYPSVRPIMKQLVTGEPVLLENFLSELFGRSR